MAAACDPDHGARKQRVLRYLHFLLAGCGQLCQKTEVQNNAYSLHLKCETEKNPWLQIPTTGFGNSLAVAGDSAQLARQEMVRRPRSAYRDFAVFKLLSGGVI